MCYNLGYEGDFMYIISEREDGFWQVKKRGSKRASKICQSKAEAVAYCQSKGYDFTVDVKIGSTELNVNSKKVKKYCKPIVIILVILILCVGIVFVLDYTKVINIGLANKLQNLISNSGNNSNNGDDNSSGHKPQTAVEGIVYEDFSIHFLELGNDYTGDSVYIKAGETDILIDAGSRKDSAETIKNYLNQYVTDNKLEYVIATHGDQDHIAGFVGSSKQGILYSYEIDNIIMNEHTNKTSQIYKDFLSAVDYATTNGANLLYADDCFNNTNGATSSFILDTTNNITMDILYNYYYFNDGEDENNYSVCTMFNYSDHHFMLTGDLELEGEEKLAAYYDGSTPAKTLPHVDLFKAGHHGSKTSSNDCLLELITPDIVCVCCCAGGSEYTANYNNVFPTQEFINRVAKYTDQVYVTSYYDEKELTFKSLNGNIVVSCDGSSVAVAASNNLTKLKDSAWFNETVYIDASGKICSDKGKKDFFTADTPGTHAVPRRIWPS